MKEQPVLSDKEWALVIELLELEREEIPAEIHRAEPLEYRKELEARRKVVDSLLARLSTTVPAE